jgi:hypothetical protein
MRAIGFPNTCQTPGVKNTVLDISEAVKQHVSDNAPNFNTKYVRTIHKLNAHTLQKTFFYTNRFYFFKNAVNEK